MRRYWLLIPAIALLSVFLRAEAAAASPPEHIGPFEGTGQFTVDCGTFEASVSGTGTFRETVFFDDNGDVIRLQQFIRAPSDVWTNTTTGKTIEVRGEFQQTYNWVPARGEYTVTVVGHRYLVNEPGSGVTVQEVGRIVYADPSEKAVLTMAGQHDLAQAARIEPVFCARLS
jgi:hypothetical protein